MLLVVLLAVIVAAASAQAGATDVSSQHDDESAPREQALHATANDIDDIDDDTPDVPECLRHFTREYQPVCASNGRVYANPSIFQYQQCRREVLSKPALTQQDMAICNERSEL